MRLSTACLLSSLALGLPGAVGQAAAAPPADEEWTPTFSEEFEEPALDSTVWTFKSPADIPARPFPDGAPLVLSDGALHLVVRHHQHGKHEWTSSRLLTHNFQQLYGYFEARLRYARSTGLANVFRLVSDGPPRGQQIIVNEGRYPCELALQLQRPDAKGIYAKLSLGGVDLSAGYHTYAVKWLPNGAGSSTITWYFDGAPVQSTDCRGCTRPLRLELDAEVLTGTGPFAPTIDGTSMDVDYVRVYQLRRLTGGS